MLLKRTLTLLGGVISAFATYSGHCDLLDSSFDQEAESLLKLLHVPGTSIAVVYNGKIEAKGYGFSQLPSTRATPDTLWFMGSTTKAFTAAAIGKIVQGNTNITGLKWSTTLSEILGNDFALSDEYANSHISLEDAMSHRSGLPRHDIAYGWGNLSSTGILQTMKDLPFSAQPRTRWQYNNLMFAAVGEVIERLTGGTVEKMLKKWLWDPIGMRSTTFSIKEADSCKDSQGGSRLARGYYWDGTHYVPDKWIDIIPVGGAGATISSVNDYALWAQALLESDNGLPNKTSPIDKNLFQALTTPRSIISEFDTGAATPVYSLGWVVGNINGKKVITHDGGLTGFGANIFLVPEAGLAFVAAGNTAGTSAAVQGALLVEVLRRASLIDGGDKAQHIKAIQEQFRISEPRARYPMSHQPQHTVDRKLPLPGKITDYIGAYLHPAYGVFNISLSNLSSPATPSSSHPSQQPLNDEIDTLPTLRIDPSPRTWDYLYLATHSTHTFFNAKMYGKHGPAPAGDPPCNGGKSDFRNLQCRNEEVLEDFEVAVSAVFEFGKDGEVERFGIELEPELVRWAEEEGGKENWREGMIWFRKVG